MHILFSVVGLSFDSFAAGLVIGSYALSSRDRFRIAIMFGVCDAAATLVGSLWLHRSAEPHALAVYLICVLLLAASTRARRALLYCLPALLSVDNLFGGVPASLAPALGGSSALMALLGLSLAALGRDLFVLSDAEV
jgi:hypothetical protein